MADYIVTGSGLVPADGAGTYVETGVVNGKPYYYNGFKYLFWSSGNELWAISEINGTSSPNFRWYDTSGYTGYYPAQSGYTPQNAQGTAIVTSDGPVPPLPSTLEDKTTYRFK